MPAIAPHVTAIPFSNVTSNSVITGGRDISTQSYELIAKGMCWSKSNPYFSLATCDGSINLGSSMDDFTIELVGLESHTQFYMSPWIQTTDGMDHISDIQSFITLDASPAPKIVSGGVGTGKRSVYNGKSVIFTSPPPPAIFFSMDASFNDLFPMSIGKTGDVFINYMNGKGLRDKSLPYYGLSDSSVHGVNYVRIDASGADFSGLTYFYIPDLSVNYLTLPNGMTAMGDLILSGNHLTNLVLPSGLTSLSRILLDYNMLSFISIPEDIGANMSNLLLDLNYNNLSSINLPNSAGFSEISLEGNQLTSIIVPNSPALAFFDAAFNPLTSLIIPENLSALTGIYVTGTLLTSITIPEGLSSMVQITAIDCSLLESVSIPSSLKAHQWTMEFQNCAFSETEINNFLIFLDTAPRPSPGSSFDFTGGTSAAPTGAGLTAKNHLNSLAISVNTN